MTSAAVPSTLVKCLYLFFDLPELVSDSPKKDGGVSDDRDDEFSPRERRRLLQKMFIQVGFVAKRTLKARKIDNAWSSIGPVATVWLHSCR